MIMEEFMTEPEEFKVLIIDDTPANIDILQKTLEGEGYSISVALNGAMALKVAQKLLPDLILLDVMMDGMDGYETCQQLKSDPNTAAAPVIFISARDEARDIIEGFKIGGVDYITKPFNTEEVLVRVKTHLFIHNLKKKMERLIEELEDKNKSLEEMHEMKNKFMAIAAHDIRNPLSSIRGFSDLIVNSGDHFSEEEKGKMMEMIYMATNHLLVLVDDLLDISVIESGLVRLDLEPSDLKKVIEEKIDINSIHAKRKDITLKAELETVPEIKIDSERMGQVVDNLISNAIKYSASNTEIRVTLAKAAGSLKLRVQDQGQGMSEEDRKNLFEGFQKLSARPTGGEKSTGLGLTIVKSIVDAHKGEIRVESEVGKGTTFEVIIPMEPAAQE